MQLTAVLLFMLAGALAGIGAQTRRTDRPASAAHHRRPRLWDALAICSAVGAFVLYLRAHH